MASPDGVEQLPQLTAADSRGFRASESFDEKAGHDKLEKHLSSDSSLAHKGEPDGKAEYDQEDDVEYVNGEPVITTGMDVSRFLIYLFKPVQVTVSTVFLLLLIYSVGIAWAKYLPRAEWVEGTRLARLAPALRFINPASSVLKRYHVIVLVASTASGGSSAVMNFAVQRLYYNTNVEATTAILATFSTACFGYVMMIFWPSFSSAQCTLRSYGLFIHLPFLMSFTALHFDTASNHKRLKVFWTAFTAVCLGGLALYIFPLLNGINVICLATQHVPSGAQDSSLDWQYITSTFMSYPLIQQANSWIGYAVCYIAIMGIYYSNVWNSKAFPMLSTSLYSQNGSTYDQDAVFGSTFQLNETALEISSSGTLRLDSFKQAKEKTQPDPHWQIVNKNYEEVPWYWYLALLVLAFFAGLIVIFKGQTTLPWYAYIVALLLGATNQLMKMVAGAVNPGKPVANLYFSMWSHDVVATSINLAGDLKIGQYLKVPPRHMFLTQVWVCIGPDGVLTRPSAVVMVSVVDAQREILLDPRGTNIWSGQYPQSLNSAAVTWSLAKQLYGPHGPYIWIPLALLFGMVPTFFQWIIAKWPTIKGMRTESIILPIIYQYAQWMSSGTNSPVMSGIIVGLVSQLWLRKYHPGWYKKYNFILGGALDGGAQVMIFILSFAVFGASGTPKPFPAWWGNPAQGNEEGIRQSTVTAPDTGDKLHDGHSHPHHKGTTSLAMRKDDRIHRLFSGTIHTIEPG
ncbi:OPT oligopeptide transporter protein-domain-containing protein [Trametes punicea]|nr:OPT oligopeptide transporter protein-domain-containing protein [Trametes punicea]